jgi:hypothetical protein
MQDLKPKPAYIAVQTLTRELNGYSIAQRLKTDSDNDWVLLCKNATGLQKLAAWTLSPSNTVTLHLTPSVTPAKAVRSDGQPADVKWNAGGLTIDLSPAPTYVTLEH